MTHLDFFSGIGGFALAAAWTGFETKCFCEINEQRAGFLEHAWPGVPVHRDVREFDGKTWRGHTVATFGVPCQPASHAGKQRGSQDDRWLWPEAVRITSEARPAWAIYENPIGLRTVGLDGILSDLEALGYQVGLFDIPAGAVNAPQLRRRIWIVATMRARDYKGVTQRGAHKPNDALPNMLRAVGTWPTLKASPSGPDYARANRPGSGGDDLVTCLHRGMKANRSSVPESGGAPSPEFALWFMGYPEALLKLWETALCRK